MAIKWIFYIIAVLRLVYINEWLESIDIKLYISVKNAFIESKDQNWFIRI